MLASRPPQRATTPNRLHHCTSPTLGGFLCSRVVSLFRSEYQSTLTDQPRPMEADGLWKARPKAAAFPQPLENAPHPPPAFPTSPTGPASDPRKIIRPPQNHIDFVESVTLDCWHLSDAELVALLPYALG